MAGCNNDYMCTGMITVHQCFKHIVLLAYNLTIPKKTQKKTPYNSAAQRFNEPVGTLKKKTSLRQKIILSLQQFYQNNTGALRGRVELTLMFLQFRYIPQIACSYPIIPINTVYL